MRIPNVHLLQDLQLQGGLAALALAGLPEFQQLVKSPQEKSSLTVLAEWRKVGPIYSFAASFIRDQFPMEALRNPKPASF